MLYCFHVRHPCLCKKTSPSLGAGPGGSRSLKAGTYTRWPPLLARLETLTEPGWIDEIDNLAPGWRKIATINAGTTAKHTLLVLAICLNLPEYVTANENICAEIE